MRLLCFVSAVFAVSVGLLGSALATPMPNAEPTHWVDDDKGNKPRPIENREADRSSSRGSSTSPNQSSDENPFRKRQRRSEGSDPGSTPGGQSDPRSANAPRNDGRVPLEGRQIPLEGRRVPLEGRPVPFEARPVLTPPVIEPNRPVPIEETTLPALVRQAELINPYRWRDRYVLVPVEPSFAFGGYYIEYQLGRFRFSYRFYYIYPEPYRVVYAPYWYYDPCPPFIMVYRVVYLPPRPYAMVVEVPVRVESPYYLERRQPNEQQQLLSDLRAAWLLRDPNFIERYIRPNSYIAIYLDGQYAYSLPAQDFIELTRDAIRAVKTEQIRFTRVSRRGDTQLVVRGEHQYIDEATGVRRLVYIHYTFERVEGRWYLIEAGSSATRL